MAARVSSTLGERWGAVPRRLPGTGDLADRIRFLDAIREEAVGVLEDLRSLLTPEVRALLAAICDRGTVFFEASRTRGPFVLSPAVVRDAPRSPLRPVTGAREIATLNGAVRLWADRWNLARVDHGRHHGAWVLCAAAKTLWDWSNSSMSAHPLHWTRGPLLFLPAHRGDWSHVRLRYALTQESPLPFTPAPPRQSRAGRWRGSAVEALSVAESWRLAMLVRWQVLGEGAVRLRHMWPGRSELSDPIGAKRFDQAISDAMDLLRRQLDLPRRPPGRPGRPRATGR